MFKKNVKVTAEAKNWLTVAEMPAVKEMQSVFKNDGIEPEWIASQLLAVIQSDSAVSTAVALAKFEILKIEFEVAGNRRADDWYFDGSGRLDVWMKVYAYDPLAGFVEAHGYYSDICMRDSTKETDDRIRPYMYINSFFKK